MAKHRIKPHQQAILDAFDAGERSPKRLAEGSGYSASGVAALLKNHGRKLDDRSAARKAAWADPAVRAKMSAASKAAWADPAVRAKMSAARKAALADPAVRAKMSAASKARRDPWLAKLSDDERRWYRKMLREGVAVADARGAIEASRAKVAA